MSGLWLPKTYRGQVHPSGLKEEVYRDFDAAIDRQGFKRLGYEDTKWGRILVAERRYMEPHSHWKVIWAVRDFAQILECYPHSSQDMRFKAAVAAAMHHLQNEREPVFREFS